MENDLSLLHRAKRSANGTEYECHENCRGYWQKKDSLLLEYWDRMGPRRVGSLRNLVEETVELQALMPAE